MPLTQVGGTGVHEGDGGHEGRGFRHRGNANPEGQIRIVDLGQPGRLPPGQQEAKLLGRDFKAFFWIDGEPIVLTEDGLGWRTVFGVRADGQQAWARVLACHKLCTDCQLTP
jgi:hypothetical protein